MKYLANYIGKFLPKRMELIRQAEFSDCGYCCMLMIMKYHGLTPSLSGLKEKHGASNRGISFKKMADILTEFGFEPKAYRIPGAHHLSSVKLPCIIYINGNHFVVLQKFNSSGLTIFDPAQGIKKTSLKDFESCFSGFVLEVDIKKLIRNEALEKKLSFLDLFRGCKGIKRHLISLLIVSLVLKFIIMLSPLYGQTVIDRIIIGGEYEIMSLLAIAFFLVLFFEAVVRIIREVMVLNISKNINLHLGKTFFDKLMELPLAYFQSREKGDSLSRANSLHALRNLVSVGLVSVLIDGLLIIFTLIVMFILSMKLATISLAVSLIYITLRYVFYKPIHNITGETLQIKAKYDSYLIETVGVMQTVKIFGLALTRKSGLLKGLSDTMQSEIRMANWNLSFRAIYILFTGIEAILIIFISANLIKNSTGFTMGMLFSFMAYRGVYTDSIDALVTRLVEVKTIGVHLDRLSDVLLALKDPILSGSEKKINLSKSGFDEDFSLKNVSYSYPGSDNFIFSNLCLAIPAGKTTLIAGPSGCGKSTLLSCLMGTVLPTKGSILLGRMSIFEIENFSQHIAAVTQSDNLFIGTISQNICLFELKPDYEKMVWAAKMASISREVDLFPMKYETFVGGAGGSLSGGQVQRLLIARALYREPKILFLDEATCHLDVDTERVVNENLKKISATKIVVAHRENAVDYADNLFCFPESRIESRDDAKEVEKYILHP